MENRGGKRDNAGRKSRAEEMKLPMLMKEVITEADWMELFKAILQEAKAGSFQHQRLLIEYRYGKPVQQINTDIEVIKPNLPTWMLQAPD